MPSAESAMGASARVLAAVLAFVALVHLAECNDLEALYGPRVLGSSVLCEFSILRSFFAFAASPGTPATCAFCKLVLTLVDEVVQGNRTEAEVAVIAKEFCELNDGAIGYHCKGYVVYCVPPCFHTISY